VSDYTIDTIKEAFEAADRTGIPQIIKEGSVVRLVIHPTRGVVAECDQCKHLRHVAAGAEHVAKVWREKAAMLQNELDILKQNPHLLRKRRSKKRTPDAGRGSK
jgi:hypothetical protein